LRENDDRAVTSTTTARVVPRPERQGSALLGWDTLEQAPGCAACGLGGCGDYGGDRYRCDVTPRWQQRLRDNEVVWMTVRNIGNRSQAFFGKKPYSSAELRFSGDLGPSMDGLW